MMQPPSVSDQRGPPAPRPKRANLRSAAADLKREAPMAPASENGRARRDGAAGSEHAGPVLEARMRSVEPAVLPSHLVRHTALCGAIVALAGLHLFKRLRPPCFDNVRGR